MLHLVIACIRQMSTHPTTIAAARWWLRLVTRTVAGSPNLPEALVAHTGAFAIAYVAAVEQRAALVCPIRLWRALKLQKRPARNRM